jgi:hypothetical protein
MIDTTPKTTVGERMAKPRPAVVGFRPKPVLLPLIDRECAEQFCDKSELMNRIVLEYFKRNGKLPKPSKSAKS